MVIGVPTSSKLQGFDSLLTMVEMPPGVPTATMGIDAGVNAALFVGRVLSLYNDDVRDMLDEFVKTLQNAY
jgi:5-(carboxyamino)imidazole ribonucleotide mutase